MNQIINNLEEQISSYDRTIEINDMIEHYGVEAILTRMSVYYQKETIQALNTDFISKNLKE